MKLLVSFSIIAMALVVLADPEPGDVTSGLTTPSIVVNNMVLPTELFVAGKIFGTSHSSSGPFLVHPAEDGNSFGLKAAPAIQVADMLSVDAVTEDSSATVIPRRDVTIPVGSSGTKFIETGITASPLDNGTTTLISSTNLGKALVTPAAPASDAVVPGMGRPETPTTLTQTVSMTVACGPTSTSAMETVTAVYKNKTTAFWTVHYPGMNMAMLISTASTTMATTIFETSSFNDTKPTTTPTTAMEPFELTTVGMDPIYTITIVQEGTFTVEGGRRMHWATTAAETMIDRVWPFSASSVTIPAVATFPAETNTV